jgi:virginiamycin B lyase
MAERTRLVAGAFAVAVTLALSLASGADAFVYWADRYDAIGRANLDGSGVNPSFINPIPVATGAYTPTGVAVDGTHVYWSANLINGTGHEEWVLGRASLAGSSIAPTFITGARFPSGVAVNGEHIYWASQNVGGPGTIGRANLDGSGINQSFIPGLSPCSVAVDSAHIYWANGNVIGRANLDGTGIDETFITLNPLNGPADTCGVAVDSKHIYWTDGGHGVIGRANLDGTGVEENLITGANGPCGVAVDTAHVYWATNGGSGVIGRANLDGTGVDQSFIHVPGPGGFMCGVAVDALLPTTTTIMSPESSVVYGQDATFTATVLNTPSSSPITPTGTVQFKVNGVDDGSPVPLDAGGQAKYTPTFLLDVGDVVTAEFNGNAQLGASTSPGAQLSVQPALTGTTLTASPNPANPGNELTFIATVTNMSTSIVPFGSVEFSIDGEAVLEPLTLDENGQAGIGVSGLRPGDHTVRALYFASMMGIQDFTGSQASVTEHITSPPPPAKPAASTPPSPPPFQATLSVFPLAPTVRGLLRGRFSDSVVLTGPGSVSENMFSDTGVLPATASRASAARHKKSKRHTAVLLARGGASIATAGTVNVTLLPTAAGKKTLKKTRHSLRVVLITSVKDAKTGNVTNLPAKTLTLKH